MSFPGHYFRSRFLRWSVSCLLVLSGCAFDITHVKQQPATFAAVSGMTNGFILSHDVKATLGTGYPTRLKSGTRWQPVGVIAQGTVFETKDQIVTVEASNIHEAQLVVSNGFITGFYLPVEKTFAPSKSPIRIETQPLETNRP